MHKITKNYTLAGIFFGVMFPIIGTCVQMFELDESIGISDIFRMHLQTPLLLIIDLAPIILGSIGYYLGLKQTKLFIISEDLKKSNNHQSIDIENLNKQLKQKADDLHQLSYVANHDLKSTLRGISSLTTFIEQETNEEEKRKLQNLLNKRIVRMEKLLDAILNFSKLTNEKNDIEELDLSELVSELLKSKKREILYSSGEFKSTIRMDRKKALAILKELIHNAIKFTPEDCALEIKTEIQNLGPYVHFTFEDNGPGIEAKYKEKVFEPFATLDLRDETENIGMGLAVVRRLIKDMGGEINLSIASGTKYEIKLPNNS